MPTALFKAARRRMRPHAHGAPSTPEQTAFDLHIDSSPIDLGLVQGFTTAADQRHRARVQAKIDVTGVGRRSASDRRVTRRERGVHRRADRRRLLEHRRQDRSAAGQGAHRRRSRCSTIIRSRSSITGDLAIHELQVGGVEIVRERRRLQGDRQQDGQRPGQQRSATSPASCARRGSKAISASSTGQVNLDQILALAGDSAYATQADRVPDDGRRRRRPDARAADARFDALQMDVHLTVPDDLVIKASDLRDARRADRASAR